MEAEQNKDNIKPKKRMSTWKVLLLNIGAMVIVGLVLIWLAMVALKSYTRHNEAFRMPDVIGMTQEEADRVLSKDDLLMEVTDSIYSDGVAPGVVLETTPKPGSMIKSDRTIYVIVNNSQTKKLTVPEVYEVSRRQAEALLRGTGFVKVTVKYVPGTFHDLALYLKDPSGRVLNSGDKVPYNIPLTLEVSSSDMMEEAIRDSLISMGVDEALIHNGSEAEPDKSKVESENSGEEWF